MQPRTTLQELELQHLRKSDIDNIQQFLNTVHNNKNTDWFERFIQASQPDHQPLPGPF